MLERNYEVVVTLSVKTLMSVHHLVFAPKSVPMAKVSTGVHVVRDTYLIQIRKPARLQVSLSIYYNNCLKNDLA